MRKITQNNSSNDGPDAALEGTLHDGVNTAGVNVPVVTLADAMINANFY